MLFIFKIVVSLINEFAAFHFRIEDMALEIGAVGLCKICVLLCYVVRCHVQEELLFNIHCNIQPCLRLPGPNDTVSIQ